MVKYVGHWIISGVLLLNAVGAAQERSLVPRRFAAVQQRAETKLVGKWTGLVVNAVAVRPALPESDSKVSSRGKVFLKSLLIPGWGQYSLRAKTSARNFFIAELALWGAVVGFNIYGKWLKNDYIDYATAYARVNPDGRDNQFWVDIGNFPSVYAYNEEKLRQRYVAALRDPSGPDFWQWDSDAHRQRFEELRIASDRAFERSSFAVFAVVTNHLVSAIHALWVWKRHQSGQASMGPRYRLAWVPVGRQGGALQVRFRF
ncbi:MAG: hypothetical protein Q9P90_07185 [candidate division KSB1 bacterium]|nr:hypothetical protein [candidate division KSB1 bacterium]